MQRRPRAKNDAHLDFIRRLPCCVCGRTTHIEAAHIRTPSLRHGKRPVGIGEKPDDAWAVPLCDGHHRNLPDSQHNIGEEKFWKKYGKDQFAIALSLWRASGDEDLMRSIVLENLL